MEVTIKRNDKIRHPIRYKIYMKPETTRLVVDFHQSRLELVEQLADFIYGMQEQQEKADDKDSHSN